jgi:hypothetical protein
MTKIAYIVLGVGIVLFVAIMLLSRLFTSTPGTTTQPQVQKGATATGTLYPVSVTVSPSSSGGQATTSTTAKLGVNDFLKDPETKPDTSTPGQYFLGNTIDPTVDAAPNIPYTITYNEKTQFFNIALLEEPIGSARQAAEQYLIQHLGVSQSQLCQLQYQVSTPAYVNGQYAGTSLGFSFCPGAVKLPL